MAIFSWLRRLPSGLGSERFSWLLAVLWAVTIFAGIPFARSFQSLVQAHLGRQCFTVTVLLLLCAVCIGSVCFLLGRAAKERPASLVWLAVLAAVYAGWTWKLSSNPEESLHFIEYGVLSALIFRALSFQIADRLIYPAAFLSSSIFGSVDEIFQWLMPDRVFDYRDILLNAGSGLLMLLVISKVWRPGFIKEPISPASIRKVCAIGCAEVLILTLCLSNTGPITKLLTDAVPGIAYLAHKDNLMSEYGYLHKEPEAHILFYSRFSKEELRRADEQRGAEIGAILKSYKGNRSYQEFLQAYNPMSDPFAHEVRVHLFRRDQYLQSVLDGKIGEAANRPSCTVARRENSILEKYFGRTLHSASEDLSSETEKRLQACADDKTQYESKVSRSLIVDFTLPQALGASALIFAVLALTSWKTRP